MYHAQHYVCIYVRMISTKFVQGYKLSDVIDVLQDRCLESQACVPPPNQLTCLHIQVDIYQAWDRPEALNLFILFV